jgi:hypothetical protein
MYYGAWVEMLLGGLKGLQFYSPAENPKELGNWG